MASAFPQGMPRLVLAPMAGVTDWAFRTVCAQQAPIVCVTEMVSAQALVMGDTKSRSLMKVTQSPTWVQLFGYDPDIMARAAVIVQDTVAADGIDINMGCPTPKIVSNGSGCALMKTPDTAARMVEAVANAVSLPVTVKCRLGWDKSEVSRLPDFVRQMQRAGAAAICVHGRTRVQLYGGRADWDALRTARDAVSVPFAANGDIACAEDVPRILRYTGADMAMIGRFAMGNPFVFAQAHALLQGQPPVPAPPLSKRMETAWRHMELAALDKGERIACLEARRHLSWYVKGIAHAGYYKQKINLAETLRDVESIIKGVVNDLS